jgi:hypothetical protein
VDQQTKEEKVGALEYNFNDDLKGADFAIKKCIH